MIREKGESQYASDAWQSRFAAMHREMAGGGSLLGPEVPEPTTDSLLMLAVAPCCLLRRRAAK